MLCCLSQDSEKYVICLPPGTLCILCCRKKYKEGTRVAKKAPASSLRYRTALGFGGLNARHPKVQGMVATKYETLPKSATASMRRCCSDIHMKMSCPWWSSVDVTYVQPPQVIVRKIPIPAMNLGSFAFGRAVRRYHNPTKRKRGPLERSEQCPRCPVDPAYRT